MRHLNSLSEAGDTIVEVMVAIAVVSAVIASAFVVTNRTLENNRQTQEHEEALKMVESQVEQLQASVSKVGATHTVNSGSAFLGNFCFVGSPPAVSTTLCDIKNPGEDYAYTISLGTGDSSSCSGGATETNPRLFKASAVWDGPTGSKENVELVYKVFLPCS